MIGIDSIPYRRWNISADQKRRLADALEACPCLGNDSSRNTVVEQLPCIRATVTKTGKLRDDIYNIVDACLLYPGGIEELIAILEYFDKGSFAVKDLHDLLQQIRPQPVSWAEIAELKSLLAQVNIDAEVVQQGCAGYCSIEAFPGPHDGGSLLAHVLGYLAKRSLLSDGTAPLLSFLAHLTPHIADPHFKGS